MIDSTAPKPSKLTDRDSIGLITLMFTVVSIIIGIYFLSFYVYIKLSGFWCCFTGLVYLLLLFWPITSILGIIIGFIEKRHNPKAKIWLVIDVAQIIILGIFWCFFTVWILVS